MKVQVFDVNESRSTTVGSWKKPLASPRRLLAVAADIADRDGPHRDGRHRSRCSLHR